MARLVQIGTSFGVIVPAPIRRELRWWPSDDLDMQIVDGMIVIQNTTQHDVTPVQRGNTDELNRNRRD